MPKAKVKKPSPKTAKSEQGMSQQNKNYVTIALLVMTLFVPIIGFVGMIMMWVWTKWKLWIKILITIPFAISVLAIVFLATYIFSYRPFMVSSDSMLPSYHQGEYVLSMLHPNGLARGEVVIFKDPANTQKDLIKRIVGLPGEIVMIKEGNVYIDNKQLDEHTYMSGNIRTYGGNFLHDGQQVTIPSGSYFVLGDNRPYSSDSREWGFVPQKNIISKVTFCYWKCN